MMPASTEMPPNSPTSRRSSVFSVVSWATFWVVCVSFMLFPFHICCRGTTKEYTPRVPLHFWHKKSCIFHRCNFDLPVRGPCSPIAPLPYWQESWKFSSHAQHRPRTRRPVSAVRPFAGFVGCPLRRLLFRTAPLSTFFVVSLYHTHCMVSSTFCFCCDKKYRAGRTKTKNAPGN